MNGKEFFKKIGCASPKLVQEAYEQPCRKRIPDWLKICAAAACLCIAVFGIVLLAQPDSTTPSPTEPAITPSDGGLQLGTSESSDEYALILNKASAQIGMNIRIDAHSWRELDESELVAVFPLLTDGYNVSATVNYSGKEVFSVEATATTPTGSSAYIQTSPGEPALDYAFDTETAASNIQGVSVIAGYYEGNETTYFASFSIDSVGYYVEMHGGKAEKAAFPALLERIISGGAADFTPLENPVLPELRDEQLTLSQAREDDDFGSYIPESVPAGFGFEYASRFINQAYDYLSIGWTNDINYIDWRISRLSDIDKLRITNVTDTGNYDLSLFPTPWAESVPDELREMVEDPIFFAEQLTLETVQMRAHTTGEPGDSSVQIRFGVLYGDVLLSVSTKAVSPEELYDMLSEIATRLP